MKKFFLLISFLSIIIFLGYKLNPLNKQMFDFHDETQPSRIKEFTLNLKSKQIPPRIAPNFNFNLGFPVFNYYAPTSYWITSFFNLIGFSIIDSLKISFLLALIISFYSMYKLANLYFNFYSSIFSGLLYVSSPWLASEIFIRGNLGTIWFIAFLPLSFYLLKKNSEKFSKKYFLLSVIILGLNLTTHNVLSLVLLPLLIIFIYLLPNKKRNYLTLIFSLLINSYFFIPAILEMNFTWARDLVKQANFPDHLLCLWQLWTTTFWGYGGSAPNCQDDGMSFMIGKPQIIFGAIGLFFILTTIKKYKKPIKEIYYYIFLTLFFIFFVSYLSYPIAKIFEKYLAFFQFPWRFLVFIILGISFFAGAINFKSKKINLLILLIGITIVFYNSKFFTKDTSTNEKFNQEFLSASYINKRVVYKVSEYLPKTINYDYWLKHEPKKNEIYLIDQYLETNQPANSLDNKPVKIIKNQPFEKIIETKSKKVIVNIGYLPYWKIYINNKNFIPKNIDLLGRPIINLDGKTNLIKIKYQQTLVEILSNYLSLSSLVLLILLLWRTKKI